MNFCVPLFHPKYFPLLKNKYFEFQADKFEEFDYFKFSLSWTRRTDHAGPKLLIEILGLFLSLNIYDNRHWNYDKNCWEQYSEENEND